MSTLLKKVTSTTSAIALAVAAVSSTLTVSAASEFATFAEELATAGVINTQSTEAGYRLGDNVTRAEMAKIAVKLGQGEAAECAGNVFGDVTSSLGDLCGYIEAAADMGIVSKANAKFRPSDLVTRAEMVKMLLAATGVAPSETSAGFSDVTSAMGDLAGYINAAVEEGIINAGASFRPNATATRGEAFKVAANVGGLTETTTPPETGTGTTGTGTGTTGTGVVTPTAAGDLSVGLNPTSATTGTQIPKAGIVKFAAVDFTAAASDVSLNSVELVKNGLSTVSSTTKVWFEKNGVRLSSKASFTSEGNVVISFAPAYVVKAGKTETLDLYVELADTTAGTDYQFASKAIVSTAKNLSGSFVTGVLRTANYDVANIDFASAGSASTYKASTDFVELGAFKLTANDTKSETTDVKFQSVTLALSGSADLANLADLKLERNGATVSTSAVVDGKNVTFTLADIVKEGTTATYYIKGHVVNVERTTDTYQFRLKNTSDINVIEANSGFRAKVNATADLLVYSVSGGDVKFERDANTALSINAAPGTSSVTLMAGTITAKNAVRLEDVRLTINTVNSGSTAGNLNQFFNTLYLSIGGSVFSVTATGAATNNLDFNGTVTINGSVPVKLYGNLKDNAPAGSIKINEMKLDSFVTTKEYVSNQETVSSSVGTIPGVTLTVDASTLNVTRNDGLGNSNLASGSKGVVLYGAQLSSSKGNPINVTSATFDVTGTNASTSTGHLNNVYATLYVNGTAVTSKTIDASTVKFDGFNVTVSPTASANLVVKADLSDSFGSGTLQLTLNSLAAVDAVSSKDIVGYSKPAGVTYTIATATATLASSDNNPQAQLFLAGSSNNKLFAFKATAKNDTIKLKDVSFTGSNLDAFTNFRLADVNGNVVANSASASAGAVAFESVATGASIAMDKSASFFVVADAKTSTNTGGIVLNLDTVKITATNGTDYTLTGAVVTSRTHAVAENTAVVAKATNSSKELTSSALRFTVTAAGKDFVTLSGASLDIKLSTSYATGAVVKIYKNSVSESNNLNGAGGNFGTTDNNGAVVATKAFTANNTVDAGSTTTYIVVVEATSNDASKDAWTIKLTNVDFGAFQANAYDNVGQFPITEVK